MLSFIFFIKTKDNYYCKNSIEVILKSPAAQFLEDKLFFQKLQIFRKPWVIV